MLSLLSAMQKRSTGRNRSSVLLSSVAQRELASGTIPTSARGSILRALAAASARNADGSEENDTSPREGEGMFVSSATAIGDEPPQKRTKTVTANTDVVEKVHLSFSVISTRNTEFQYAYSLPLTFLDGRSRRPLRTNPHLRGKRQCLRTGYDSDIEKAAQRQCANRRRCHPFYDLFL